MALDSFEANVASLHQQAQSVHNAYSQQLTTIDADTSLSDLGKSEQKSRAYGEAKERLKALRQQEEAQIDASINSRRMLIEAPSRPSGAEMISYRDAQDRADRVENADEAKSLIERALRQNDLYLAHAIFDRSLRERWRDVSRVFTLAKPEYTETVRELQHLSDIKDARMERTMKYAIWAG